MEFKSMACKKITAVCGIFIVSFMFITSSAQAVGPADLDVTVVPEVPGPNTRVTLSVESYATDLDRGVITWIVNGKTALSGIGKTVLEIRTGAVGSETSVVLTVKKLDGATLNKTLIFHPGEVDLWWQADSYTPSLYKGKALHTSLSKIKIQAVPNIIQDGVRVAPEKLVYKWQKGKEVLQADSGYGKSTITINGSKLFGSDLIRLYVSTMDNKVTVANSVTIPTVNPDLRFYEDKPLAGVWYNEMIGNEISPSQPLSIKAEPYFSTESDINSGVVEISWLKGGTLGTELGTLFTITPGTQESVLQCSVGNSRKVLQTDSRELRIRALENK